MKMKKLLSFVVLSAFAALAQMVRADEVTGYFYDGITNIAVVAEASSVMSNFTIKATQVNKKLPGGWNVVAAYNLWSKSEWYRLKTQDLIDQGLKDGYLAEATYSWSDSDLIISGKSGFDSFALLCEPILYGITFDPNFTAATEEDVDSGMDPMEDISYADTTTQLDQNVYERVGYDFAGWTTDAKNKKPNPPIADQAYVSSLTAYVSRLVTSLTLYAKWTPHTYTIEYDDNKGTHDPDTASRPTSADYDKAFEATNPTRTGYVFTGWVLDGDYDETSACYGSSKSSCSTPFSSSDNGYVSTAKVSDKKTGLVNLASEDGAAVSLVAQWRPLQINVVINEGNATNTYVVAYDSISDEEDYQALPITTPERAGYVFNGWKVRGHNSSTALYGFSEDSDSCTTPFPADGVFPADIGTFYVTHLTLKDGATVTFTAQWRKIDNYTIVYDENGGTAGSSRPTEGSYNVALKISNPKMTGYTFAGWALSGDDSDLLTARYSTDGETYSKFENGVAKPAEDSAYNYIYVKNLASKDGGVSVTLIAQWTPNTANVTIDDGAETSTTTALKYGATLKIEPPKKDGSTFIGWKTTGISTTTACYGEDAYSCENPITDILDETNFIVTAESFYVKNLTPNDGGAVTFLARWKTTYYNVSVNWNDGEPSTKKWIPNKVYDEQIFIQAPTRSGYTFKGWKISGGYDPETISYGMDENTITVSPDGQKIETFSDLYFKNMASEDGATVILTAQWTANTANVTVAGVDGDTVKTNAYGDVIEIAAPTNRTGYTFTGWTVEGYDDTARYGFENDKDACTNKIAEVDGVGVIATNVTVWAKELATNDAANVTFTPSWTANVYKVVCDWNDGDPTHTSETNRSFGEKFLVEAPTDEGRTFSGWQITGGYDPETFLYEAVDVETGCVVSQGAEKIEAQTRGDLYFTSVASTNGAVVTLTAKWTTNAANVTVRLDADDEGASFTNAYGDVFTLAPTNRTGYVFKGWTAEGFEYGSAKWGTAEDAVNDLIPEDGKIAVSDADTTVYVMNLATNDGANVTFTADWDAIGYKIEYRDAEDGSEITDCGPAGATFDAEKFLVTAPTKPGRTFAGWLVTGGYDPKTFYSETVSDEGSRVVTLDGTTINESRDLYFKNMASTNDAVVTLSALWTKNAANVTVAGVDGDTVKTNAYGDVIEIAAPTNRTGYTFTGWTVEGYDDTARYGFENDEAVCTNKIAEVDGVGVIATNVTVWAKELATNDAANVTFTPSWTANVYKVVCDWDIDGRAATTNTHFFGEKFLVEAPTDEGRTFSGWQITGGYDPETFLYEAVDVETGCVVSQGAEKIEAQTRGDLYFTSVASTNGAVVTLTAKWTTNAANVTVRLDADDEGASFTNAYGDVFTLAPTNRTGYTFIGWDVEGYGDTALYGTNKTDVVNETDVKKIAEVDGEIRFDDTNTVVYAKNLSTTNGANVTFTPAFNPIVYNIVYDDAGGTYDPATAKRPPTAVFDGEKFLVTAPTRDDYVFIGWNVSGGYDTNTIFSVVIDDETSRDVTFDGTTLYTDRDIWFRNMASTSNATVTLTALWTQVSVSVTIDGVTQTNDYSKILPIEVPEKDGYVFDGWKAEGYDATTARYGATTNLSEMAAFPADGYFPASLGSFYVTHLSMTDGAIITFTSQWKPISYKIVYDEDGGTAGRDRRDSADYDEAFKVYKPTRTGYAFAGWELSGDCNLETASSGTSGGQCTPNFSDAGIVTTTSDIYFKNLASATNATVTLKALWTAHTTTVTTDINGTSKSDTATYDEPMLLSVNPPTGYVFHGWKVKNLAVASALYGLDEDSCTNSIAKIMTNDTYVAVTQDIYVKNLREDNGRTVTFTADLEAIPYAVTCAANGGEPVASWPTNAVYDKAFLVTKPARTGYAFSGWALSGDYDTSTAVYGGSSADCSTKFKTSSDSAVAETSRDAYFKNLVTTTNSSVTLTAQWTANATTVIIDRNGTETQLTLDYDKLQKISPDPIEDGYGFHGWNVNGFDPESALYGFDRTSCTNKFPADGYIAVTRDIYVKNLTTTKGATVTFTAKLTPASYTIEYDVQDGTLGAESPTSKGYADEAFCVSAPTRTGYAFAGWKIDGDFDAETARYGEIKARCTSEIPKNNKIETTGDIWFAKLASEDGSVVKLIAQWTANKATYVTDIKGTQSSPQEASYGTPLKLPVPDAGKGYAFKGWQVEGFATNISCYGESEQACTNAIPESGIIATSGAVWVKNLRTDNNSDQVVAFTALLDPISYQLVYKEEGGILGAEHPDTATYDVPFFVSAPTQKGYTFMGWKVENYDAETACYGVESNACTTAVTNDAMTAGGDLFLNNLATVQDAQVVLTATWDLTAPSYDVEYVENGGGGHDRPHEALKYGTAYLVSASARTGYEFTGWSVFGFDPETAYYGDTKECVSRFPANGNLDVKTDIYVKNLTMIGQKITFTAKWNVIVYGLKYSDGEGTELNCGPETNAYDNVVAIKPPTKANSRFVGWTVTGYSSTARYGLSAGSCTMEIGNNGKIEQSGTIYVKNLSTEAGETVQFTALWETPSCAITYKLDGGSIPAGSSNPATITYGSPVLIKAPTKSTTTFIGWKVVDCGDEALWGDDPDNAASCTNAIPADGVILAKGDIWIKNFLATSSSASATMTALWEADWSGMYTVVFNSNDGASETSTQKIAIGVKTALTSNTFVRTGYTFQGWAKAPDATAKDYADGASVTDLSTTPGAKIDLYAVWQANTYTVEFFANGGYGKMDSVTATYDKLFTLPANKFTPPANSTFVGWYRLGETYEAGATVSNLTATADGIVTLSAQWSTTTTDLSKAMDCTNLSWENLNPKYAIQWVVTNDVGHGTSSCVCQQNGNLDDRSPLIAQLKASSVTSKVTGTLKFWWKPSSSSAKLQWATSQKKGYVMDMTEISAEGPDWQEVTIEIDSVDAYYLILENDSDAVTGTYEYIDAMSWEVPDVAIAPTTVNAVQSLSMASPSSTSSMTSAPESSDAMTLSFTGDERFAYRVLYKDDLTEKDWHVLETVEIQNGTGGEQAFTVPRDNTSSRFYTIETIQK